MNHRSAGRSGFSLVEIVVALVLLSVGLLGLAAQAAVIARSAGAADVRARLAFLAAAEMEQMMARRSPAPDSSQTPESGFRTDWQITTGRLTEVRLTVRYERGLNVASDTLITLLAW